MARFVFPSALVEKDEASGSLRVCFFARTDDAMVLTIDGEPQSKNFLEGALIKLKVEAPRGPQSCDELPEETGDYTPGIEFHFTGKYEARVEQVHGEDGFVVESVGVISCIEGCAALPWTMAAIGSASVLEIGGERGIKGPHHPRRETIAAAR